MAQFMGKLHGHFTEDGYHFILSKMLTYDSGVLKIDVPVGFKTDFGSVPKLLWGLIPPIGPALLGYVVHDYLYATAWLSRRQSDAVLLEIAGVSGMSWLRRSAVYSALRIFGSRNFGPQAMGGPRVQDQTDPEAKVD